MLENKTIAFIGAGNMGEALIRGLLDAQRVKPSQLIATDVRAERLRFFEETLHIRALADNAGAVRDADIVVLAVKPQQMGAVLPGCRAGMSDGKLVITIAAGVTTGRIERELGGRVRVVRVMPNMPALVRAGAAALCKGAHATDADLAVAEAILGSVGTTVRVEEQMMDAVTALSGSGPAYVFRVAEAMIQAGVAAGLTEAVASQLTLQTIYGAAKLMVESGESPASLRRKVTSPGGTTEAALEVMVERKLMEIFAEAIHAAARRGRELAAGA